MLEKRVHPSAPSVHTQCNQWKALSDVPIEGSKLACDTGGHFTNYPTWPLARTNPNVDVLNNSLNYYALADLMLCRLSVNIKHISNSMFTDVLAVTPHIIDYLLPFAL